MLDLYIGDEAHEADCSTHHTDSPCFAGICYEVPAKIIPLYILCHCSYISTLNLKRTNRWSYTYMVATTLTMYNVPEARPVSSMLLFLMLQLDSMFLRRLACAMVHEFHSFPQTSGSKSSINAASSFTK